MTIADGAAVGFRAHKSEARRILFERDRDALLAWAESVRDPFRVLISLTYETDELLRWRAIEATGWVAATFAEQRTDKLRDTIRRLLWLMNDESGGLARHAPELIGEILHYVPFLIPEYASVLPSFLREEPFERGTHFAIYRVALVDPQAFTAGVPALLTSLEDRDAYIRCFAALALIAMGTNPAIAAFDRLQVDQGNLTLYDWHSGRMRETTIAGELTRFTT